MADKIEVAKIIKEKIKIFLDNDIPRNYPHIYISNNNDFWRPLFYIKNNRGELVHTNELNSTLKCFLKELIGLFLPIYGDDICDIVFSAFDPEEIKELKIYCQKK